MRFYARHLLRLATFAACGIATTAMASAQSTGVDPLLQAYATRAELQARADSLDARVQRATQPQLRESLRSELWLLQQRLEGGDFRVGDRIVLSVRGETALTDTFAVNDGISLRLPALGDLPLRGVLRSELDAHLSTQLGRYLREPDVHGIPLIRVAVTGHIARPGFYHVAADLLLSDLVMLAGGPAADGDLQKASVQRGSDKIWDADDVRIALREGMSLDQFHLRGGDELVVSQRRQFNWQSIIQMVTVVTGLVSLAIALGS